MNNDDIQIYFFFCSVAIIIYFFHGSLLRGKSLTGFQRNSRTNLIFKQIFIITICIGFAFMFDFFGIFIFEVLNIGTFTQENFILGIFVFLTFLILIVNYFYDKKLSEKDERVVNIKQESVFDNIKAKEKIVKKIINYAHYFNGIEYEKSQKDYSVLNVNIKINKDEMIKFTKIQNSVIEVTPFYVNLIGYLNSKSENFGFKKIEQIQIDDLKKIKELKYLILNKFTVMKQKHYFASISQLYQVASNIDEMEFLSFLNDFPHGKYSSLSLRHAIFYVKEK